LVALRDSADLLKNFDAEIFMISLDDPQKNKEFSEALGSAHVLLSDPEKKIAEAYGVIGFGGLYARRWTYYIDREGVVRDIDKNVDTQTAGQDIAARLESLDFYKRN
tara:strand:+ start:202 stop:522 length:321 start_codon:yes stop_codon:yes gene_type:complete